MIFKNNKYYKEYVKRLKDENAVLRIKLDELQKEHNSMMNAYTCSADDFARTSKEYLEKVNELERIKREYANLNRDLRDAIIDYKKRCDEIIEKARK